MKKTTLTLAVVLFAFIFALPALAVERPKGLEDQGPLTKITLIHYKKGYTKPPWAGGANKPKEEKCYSFLANGAKWKDEIGEDYVVNPNGSGLDDDFVLHALGTGVSEWNNHSLNVLGAGSIDNSILFDGDTWDNVNSVSFGSYSNDNVIAVTNVWGYFYGKPSTREIVEWDMLFNTHWNWGDGADTNTSLMDLQNIATHELGHSAGMGHPNNTCTEETMYAYSSLDEIIKRDLHAGDIAGIQALYK